MHLLYKDYHNPIQYHNKYVIILNIIQSNSIQQILSDLEMHKPKRLVLLDREAYTNKAPRIILCQSKFAYRSQTSIVVAEKHTAEYISSMIFYVLADFGIGSFDI